MRALVVHPGTQHSFRLAVELNRLNALSGLHTGFAVGSGGTLEWVCDYLPAYLQRRVSNRRIKEMHHSLVHLQPALEWAALAAISQSANDQGVLHWRNERFQRNIPLSALEEADVIIGFDTSSWILVRRCRELGKPLVMIQTIGHPDSKEVVNDDLKTRFPEWFKHDAPRLPRVRQAEQEEHEGATLIVVSSSFTRQTLIENGVAPARIRVIPHGVDSDRFSPGPVSGQRPFRFIFAGLVDARKGVPLLLEAWRQLKHLNAELWLVGPASRQIKALLPNLPGLRYLGAVPHVGLAAILRQCDVFVFPSYFEGFGLVILEAMACGLPVITTTATAGPELFLGGEGGWVIPRGDAQQLAETMGRCLEDPEKVTEAGRRAREIAEQFNWLAYGKRWLPVLEEAASIAAGVTSASLGPQPVKERGDISSGATSTIGVLREASTTPSPPLQVLLAHPGTQYSGRLASQLQRRGVLGEFHTCFAFSDQSRLAQGVTLLPARWQKILANRSVANVPPSRMHTWPWLELAALASLRFEKDEQAVFYRRNRAFQRSIPDESIQGSDTVIGFDTSSWIIARRTREFGRVFFLDQSIGHPRTFARVAPRLNAEFPDWAERIYFKSEEEFAREAQEHADATRVIVPSRFVARTLQENGVDAAKIRLNPFGVDLECFQPATRPPSLKALRFVFAGSLQPRKGLPLLLNAWRQLPGNHGAELWIAGGGELPVSVRSRLPDSVHFLGRLPQSELAELFRQCHVFVFPSYFEGLAQVQIEAAACGLPVIGTESSGCEEIVRQGETGFVLPTGDFDALYAALLHFISEPELALTMRERLLAERSRFSWDAYGERWIQVLREAA